MTYVDLRGTITRELVIQSLLGAYATVLIDAKQLDAKVVEFCTSGKLPTIEIRNYRHQMTIAALDCDCGKGFLCPLVKTTKRKESTDGRLHLAQEGSPDRPSLHRGTGA